MYVTTSGIRSHADCLGDDLNLHEANSYPRRLAVRISHQEKDARSKPGTSWDKEDKKI